MAATDNFSASGDAVTRPLTRCELATGSDSTDLSFVTRAIHVGVAGNIKFTTVGGDTVTAAFTAGWHPIRLTRVWTTSLTATGVAAWS